jgi:hypothetical protein
MTAGISPVKKGKPAWLKSVPARAALAATFFMLLACGAGIIPGAATSRPGEASGKVAGLVVEVTGRNIVELETLGIRDEDGTVWTFTAEGPLEFSPSHLREHQLFGETVTVSYVRRKDVLVAVEISD